MGLTAFLGIRRIWADKHLSGTYGHPFCEYVKWEYAPAGLADLGRLFCPPHIRLLRPGGFTAFITTNSIKDGDIRKDGLEQFLPRVERSIWPCAVSNGRAGQSGGFSVSHCIRGSGMGSVCLMVKQCPAINAYLRGCDGWWEPVRLAENADRVFQGSIFLGDGFLLTHEEAEND